MGKYAELKAASEAAEAALSSVSLAESDAALKACEQADKALFAYQEKVDRLRAEFKALEVANPFVVDVCTCMENAAGVRQDGHDENDIEYWSVMLATARDMAPQPVMESSSIEDIKIAVSGRHIGPVAEIKSGYAIQSLGRGDLVAHDLSKLAIAPKVGETLNIQYRDGKPELLKSKSNERDSSPSFDM